MKVGASLNAKGWGMISEGLTMLETATAGENVPTLVTPGGLLWKGG